MEARSAGLMEATSKAGDGACVRAARIASRQGGAPSSTCHRLAVYRVQNSAAAEFLLVAGGVPDVENPPAAPAVLTIVDPVVRNRKATNAGAEIRP